MRSSAIERIKDPKPILSQTGSPFLPGSSSNFNQSRSSVKRYRPTNTVPIISAAASLPQTHFEPNYDYHFSTQLQSQQSHHPLQYETTNFTATPYHDKRMVSQIQKSLNRVAHHTPAVNSSYGDTSSYGSTVTLLAQSHNSQLPPSQQHYSTYEPHHSSANNKPLPKIVNLQYNSPMGLYSENSVKEELFKKIG